MARGSKIGYKRKTRNKVRFEKKGSDESDEDYRVDEDEEFDGSDEEYCSLAEDESEDILGEFEEEEEEEWAEKKIKKARRPTLRKGSEKRKKNEVTKPRRKKVVVYSEEEEEEEKEEEEEEEEKEEEVEEEEEEEEFDGFGFACVKQRKKTKVSLNEEEDDDIEFFYREEKDEVTDEKPRKKAKVPKTEIHLDSYKDHGGRDSCTDDMEDDDFDDSNDEDVEYNDSADEDDEEFSPVENATRTRRKPVKKRVPRRRKKYNPIKKSRDEKPASRKRRPTKKWVGKRRKKSKNTNSDSDFVSLGSSDYEFTISEEEREQVREATEFCRRSTSGSRSSNSMKIIKGDDLLPTKGRDPPGRKGKQKVVEDLNLETRKQVCGICLSEEAKRTVRGILNCCSHYFCFACIMEWSKVESRCPLCKQRFMTISRTARADGSTDAVFPVPERDQVYQPSEEELRGYLDPYENVHCTECQLGGDDAFMLLCDLCDSPAHTYCVGLGHHVPDGNWYCDGCRPTALASSTTAHPTSHTPDRRAYTGSSSPAAVVHEMFDLNEAYVPETPMTPAAQSPPGRPSHPIWSSQALPPVSRSGAATLSSRRRIQRQIHQLLNSRNRNSNGNQGLAATGSLGGISLFGSAINHRSAGVPARTVNQQSIYFQRRLGDVMYGRGEGIQGQASTSGVRSFGGLMQTGSPVVSGRAVVGLSQQQLHPCSGMQTPLADGSTATYQFREELQTVARQSTVPSRTYRGPLHTPF